jgi:hypothetical protein
MRALPKNDVESELSYVLPADLTSYAPTNFSS